MNSFKDKLKGKGKNRNEIPEIESFDENALVVNLNPLKNQLS